MRCAWNFQLLQVDPGCLGGALAGLESGLSSASQDDQHLAQGFSWNVRGTLWLLTLHPVTTIKYTIPEPFHQFSVPPSLGLGSNFQAFIQVPNATLRLPNGRHNSSSDLALSFSVTREKKTFDDVENCRAVGASCRIWDFLYLPHSVRIVRCFKARTRKLTLNQRSQTRPQNTCTKKKSSKIEKTSHEITFLTEARRMVTTKREAMALSRVLHCLGLVVGVSLPVQRPQNVQGVTRRLYDLLKQKHSKYRRQKDKHNI